VASVISDAMHDFLICPITLEVMRDPVVAADGHSYERCAIEQWLEQARSAKLWPLSPLTLLPLRSTRLLPNIALRKACQQLAGTQHVRDKPIILRCNALEEAYHPLRPAASPRAPRSSRESYEEVAPALPPAPSHSGGPRHRMLHIALMCCVAMPVIALLLAENVFFSLSMGLSVAEAAARTLSHCGGALGAPLLFTGVGLCGAGVCVRDERAAVLFVIAGAPLAITSFCHGLAAAKGGDATSALFLSRCLLLAGFFFCSIGLHLAGRNVARPAVADPLRSSLLPQPLLATQRSVRSPSCITWMGLGFATTTHMASPVR
jgi:hypothetical protein